MTSLALMPSASSPPALMTFCNSAAVCNAVVVLPDDGGPNNSTITATYWIYNQAFVAFKFGYSTAMSVVLMLFLVVLGAIQLRILRRDVTGS